MSHVFLLLASLMSHDFLLFASLMSHDFLSLACLMSHDFQTLMSVLLISTIAMDSLKYVRTCTVTFNVYVMRAS